MLHRISVTVLAWQDFNRGPMGKLDSLEQMWYREVLLLMVQHSSPLIAFFAFCAFLILFSEPFFTFSIWSYPYIILGESFSSHFVSSRIIKSGKCLQSSIHISFSLSHKWLFETLHSGFTFFWSFWWIFESSCSNAKFFSQILVPKLVLQITLLVNNKIAFDPNKHEAIWKFSAYLQQKY